MRQLQNVWKKWKQLVTKIEQSKMEEKNESNYV
jgi:hypothetical protein